MNKAEQSFGGSWTDIKLNRLRKYLTAYTNAMKKQRHRYKLVYIDAFAGTGYRTSPKEGEKEDFLFSEMEHSIDGSARIALQVAPEFDQYIFIERDSKKFAELQRLKQEFSHLAERILPINEDANTYLKKLCDASTWKDRRGVLFLDPFGMQVDWDTIKTIAKTEAIDVWYLFPLMAISRMLKRQGDLPDSWRKRIDGLLGASDWYDLSYQTSREQYLFGEEDVVKKIGDFDSIINYVKNRLKGAFPGVAENPLPLLNSRKTPIFLLCFSVSNPSPQAIKLALKIAQDILRR